MMTKKKQRILLIGGPGSGKTSVINELQKEGHYIHPEISREVTLEAQKKGIEQLFLVDPFAFSNALLEGRIKQHKDAVEGINFYDRGIPDIPAYHVFKGEEIPGSYIKACQEYRYDHVFFFPPWEKIYSSDNERYESYDEAVQIGSILIEYYERFDYQAVAVPPASLKDRVDFIKDKLETVER